MTEPPRRLLHVEASPRGPRSRSSAVARRLIERLGSAQVETLNLFDTDLPPFDGAVIEARYALIGGEPVPLEMIAAWDRIGRAAAHLLSFDIWLFSVPMWNFGIPYRLKHYIDIVTQPGMLFSADAAGAVVGLAAGRTAILVGSGALDIRAGSPLAALDHQAAFLRSWLGFVGIVDIHPIDIRPTFAAAGDVERTMAAALAEADRLAERLR